MFFFFLDTHTNQRLLRFFGDQQLDIYNKGGEEKWRKKINICTHTHTLFDYVINCEKKTWNKKSSETHYNLFQFFNMLMIDLRKKNFYFWCIEIHFWLRIWTNKIKKKWGGNSITIYISCLWIIIKSAKESKKKVKWISQMWPNSLLMMMMIIIIGYFECIQNIFFFQWSIHFGISISNGNVECLKASNHHIHTHT